MKRREFLKCMAGVPLFGTLLASLPVAAWAEAAAMHTLRRVRPGELGWPSADLWVSLNKQVHGRLMKLSDPMAVCRANPSSKACSNIFKAIRNPYYILDHANLTQTSGWVSAWTSQPSAYAVAAQNASDVAAAVNFAREHRLRLVVKGAGHSYQGTSDAPDSLLVWTHHMDKIEMHDAFIPRGCAGKVAPQPAVSCDAGCVWGHTYNAVTTNNGRYVQGGDCMTVGVAGLISSGGFGAWSKRYGTAAANLLEAEVVTADGKIRIVNAYNDPDLFWALKGGGGGTFGVLTRVTLRTFELPKFFGVVDARVEAKSKEAYRRLIERFISHYHQHLFNPHWGEQVHFQEGHVLRISMLSQGLGQGEIENAWKPFFDFVRASSNDYTIPGVPTLMAFPARGMWDPGILRKEPGNVVADSRPGAPIDNIVWAGDAQQSGWYLYSWGSAWLPQSLLQPVHQKDLASALFAASQQWDFTLQFNKALGGGLEKQVNASRNTATNPQALDAFALALAASDGPPAFPGIKGHEPDMNAARKGAAAVKRLMDALYKVAPDAGSYVAESDYFLRDWQRAFWGANYARLLAVKRRYDPEGLFTVHHGVGSEAWAEDGFVRTG